MKPSSFTNMLLADGWRGVSTARLLAVGVAISLAACDTWQPPPQELPPAENLFDDIEVIQLSEEATQELDVENNQQFAFAVAVSATGKITYFYPPYVEPQPLLPLEDVTIPSSGIKPVTIIFYEASPGCAGSTHGGDGGRFCP